MVEPQDLPQPAEEQCDLVVIGAGMAALHALSRLPDRLLKGTVVVDGSGAGWLAGWAERRAALAAPHVRTPVMQHPHAQPLALQAFAEKRGRLQELTPVAKGFAPVPSLPLFLDFCATKVVGRLPASLREPRQDTVLRIQQLGTDEGTGCHVHLASGRVLHARAAIYTAAPRQPVLPAWARALAAAPAQPVPPGDAAAQGADRAQQAQRSLPAGITTSDQVDLRCAELAGRSVAVVGGGMSAGLLAAGAAERGAQVTLVCRRPLVPQPFETEVGWWGAKQLNEYGRVESPALRLRACQRARRQGSVHLPVWRRLTQQAAAGRLTVLEGWEIAGASPCTPPAQQQDGGSAASAAGSSPRWWLTARRRVDPALPSKQVGAPTLFQQAVAAALAARAEQQQSEAQEAEQQGKQQGEVQQPQQAQQAQQAQQQEQELGADLLWLACGQAYDAAADPVLSQLQAQRPTLLAGGYPLIDDEHLCWPGAAVYLAGRSTLLTVGPCAGDLPGMRLAADRIVASLQRLDYADAPVWDAAQQRLLERLQRLAGPPSSGPGAGAAGADASITEQLAAAISATAATLPLLPLEAEGRMYEEPRPQKKLSKPDNLIDVSDLDPALPRKELTQYKFTDDDFELCVICQLDEPVPLDQVRVLFGGQHLEMWAVGASVAYHLHVPKLYGKVVTKKCSVKVNQKAKKVYLLLHKECDAEWRFLKG
ncbi:hypothetical protein ABPG75_007051 [Micractinium tetrahymenae]